MKVYLVRHGETPLNAARILQHPDTPLSERGAVQAERVAQRLAGCGVAAILTSDAPPAGNRTRHRQSDQVPCVLFSLIIRS